MQFASRRRLYFWATLVAASALAAGCSSGTATSGGGSQSSASGNYPVTAAVLHAFTVLGLVAVIAAVVLFFTDRLTGSPWGRRLRAMRDNTEAAESLGTSVRAESLKVYVIGGAIAAVSGGLLVEFIGAWSPAAWGTGETFIFFVAIIVGGLGNNFGAFFGALLVLGAFLELPTFLPTIGSSNTEESVQTAAIGVLILVFLWWRPQGVFPERKRELARFIPGARTQVGQHQGRRGPGPARHHPGRPRPQPGFRRGAGGGQVQLRAAARDRYRPDRTERGG